jgi:pimeloyl-ACP methyl ester carboxylesterase
MKKEKSSTPFEVPPFIRWCARTSERISPSLATRVGLLFFFRPQRFPTPHREKEMLGKSQQKKLTIPSIKKTIHTYQIPQKGHKVLLLHGWSGRATQLYAIAKTLNDSGMEIVSFDAPAHGSSDGKTTNIVEFVACVHEVYKNYGPFDHIIGHSMGGLVALNSAREGLKFKTLTVIGSGDKIKNVFLDYTRKMEFTDHIADRMIGVVEKRFKGSLEHYSGSHSIKNLTIPVQIAHDEQDYEIPVSYAKDLHKASKKGRLTLTNGLGHRRILRDRDLIMKITKFIKSNS